MRISRLGSVIAITFLAACSSGGQVASRDQVFAPGVDPRGQAVSGLETGYRLMAAREHELALQAFQRAAVEEGLTAEVLSSMGQANLGLGRLGQAETLVRRAADREPTWPELWNNLGVILMERNKPAQAADMFRKAYALDNGQSDSIRDNLRLALDLIENTGYDPVTEQDYKLVRRGSSDYLIRRTSG